ncbi:hypothetical protein [Haloarchaeobius sp. HME9146]|uniref:hypothetical protein n=1 Tax=Haloarchaeobius sp. HME9146 TaxID=2978732 RepID=UPI0021C1B196|nr:hypothetical protein [Haloarchaeobius sp. HME9146]MCT9094421.1 hypothetical protein [Haloarchaeobius sp. HME9146]
MADSGFFAEAQPTLLAWCLGTYHTATLTAAGVASLHLSGALGDPLGGLNTVVGFAAFLYLWAVTLWTTTRVLGAVELFGPDRSSTRAVVAAGAKWGAVTGLLFFLGVLLTLAFAFLGEMLVLLLFFGIGGAFALAIGTVVGLAFSLLDVGLLALSRWLVPPGAPTAAE